MSLEPVLSLLTSPENPEPRAGAFHDGIAHMLPVKDLRWSALRSHFRHGLPLRSSARRPALMAPVFAFGPSLWFGTGFGATMGPFFESFVRSMVPSALDIMLARGLAVIVCRCQVGQEIWPPCAEFRSLSCVYTYSLGFFLGPGLPRSRKGAFGSIAGGARFRPVTVPPPRRRRLLAVGGASELASVSSFA